MMRELAAGSRSSTESMSSRICANKPMRKDLTAEYRIGRPLLRALTSVPSFSANLLAPAVAHSVALNCGDRLLSSRSLLFTSFAGVPGLRRYWLIEKPAGLDQIVSQCGTPE